MPPADVAAAIDKNWEISIARDVRIPDLNQPEAAAKFMGFLHSDTNVIEVTLGRFINDHWETDKETGKISWPKDGVLYPE